MPVYNHRVQLQKQTGAAGSMTNPEQWTTVATVWAAFSVYSTKAQADSGRETSEIDTKISIRYMLGVTEGMRVVYGSRVFNITAVINIKERNRELELKCRELI